MRTVLILMMLMLTLTGCGEQRTIDGDLLQERGELSYVPNESEPYTGRATTAYESGQLDMEMSLVNGKLNGLTRQWYENGQLQAAGTFVDGKENCLTRSWDERGQLSHEATYVDGKIVDH